MVVSLTFYFPCVHRWREQMGNKMFSMFIGGNWWGNTVKVMGQYVSTYSYCSGLTLNNHGLTIINNPKGSNMQNKCGRFLLAHFGTTPTSLGTTAFPILLPPAPRSKPAITNNNRNLIMCFDYIIINHFQTLCQPSQTHVDW